jgi:predicted neuraminidase
MKSLKSAAAASFLALSAVGAEPVYQAGFLFPKEQVHNHSSMIAELPDGGLFTVWYRGSGERQADDVQLMYSRRPPGGKQWSKPALLADTPGFPDCNPTIFVDSRRRLWLVWPVILANEWHTALLKYKISSDYGDLTRPPRWEVSEDMLFVPRNFAAKSLSVLEPMRRAAAPDSREAKWAETMIGRAQDKYFSRMGWMPRAHPVELKSGRIIVPLYSDGYDYSLMAITDDGGRTWTSSEPLVAYGSIQPSIARKRDGTLVTYMRDNGPPPKRLHVAESKDDGITWSPVRDTDLPNPGSGAEVITLADGRWLLAYNDTEKGRHSLAVALSDDEGATWKWKRHLELDTGNNYGYPSLMQARDGTIHATYSHTTKPGQTIKHAHFNLTWVEAGDPPRAK